MKLEEKSKESIFSVAAGTICDFNELKVKSDLNSDFLVSTVEFASELSTLIKLVLLKLSTKNPDLNLLKPSAS